MRIPGIVGGIGPESTIDYYRKILSGFRERRPVDPEPHLIIHSAPMYPDAFADAALTVITPTAEEQTFIHTRYVNELVAGQFLPATRDALTEIVSRMVKRDGIDALILGGTELSLLFANAKNVPVPLLDAAALHAEAIVQEMINVGGAKNLAGLA